MYVEKSEICKEDAMRKPSSVIQVIQEPRLLHSVWVITQDTSRIVLVSTILEFIKIKLQKKGVFSKFGNRCSKANVFGQKLNLVSKFLETAHSSKVKYGKETFWKFSSEICYKQKAPRCILSDFECLRKIFVIFPKGRNYSQVNKSLNSYLAFSK